MYLQTERAPHTSLRPLSGVAVVAAAVGERPPMEAYDASHAPSPPPPAPQPTTFGRCRYTSVNAHALVAEHMENGDYLVSEALFLAGAITLVVEQ